MCSALKSIINGLHSFYWYKYLPLKVIRGKKKKKVIRGFPGGAVVKNPPANAEHTGSSPGPERSHMPRSN